MLAQREDLAYQKQQEEQARQMQEREAAGQRQQQLMSSLTPEQQKVVQLGGGSKLAESMLPQKNDDVNWQTVQTDKGYAQVHPRSGATRPLGLTAPDKKRPVSLSATAQKELFEAEDVAAASQNVISSLQEALKINEQAYSGYGAKERAVAASNLPLGDKSRANATVTLDNIMTSQALESLKAVFGGMPTEGERKILLDMQASVDKTPAQRKEIMTRAMESANRRIKLNQEKARRIRSGEFFQEQPDTQQSGADIFSQADAILGGQ